MKIVKKVLFLLFIVCLSVPGTVSAETYYVDATNGNDEWPGTLKEPNESMTNGPWATLSRVTRIASLNPGDSVLFKRGETWIGERLFITSSGTENLPITIGAYGEGADPIFDGNGTTNRGITLGKYDSEIIVVHYVKVGNIELTNYTAHGLTAVKSTTTMHGPSNCTIHNIYSHHNGGNGIYMDNV